MLTDGHLFTCVIMGKLYFKFWYSGSSCKEKCISILCTNYSIRKRLFGDFKKAEKRNKNTKFVIDPLLMLTELPENLFNTY